MKIDLSEIERKLSNGINLTIKESTILLESIEGFIDDKIELQEQLSTAKYFFKNILDVNPYLNKGHVSHLENCVRVMKNSAEKALAAIGDEGSGDE